MTQLLIDTDVLIDYLRDRAEAVTYLESFTSPLSVSAITVAELYAGVRDGSERTTLDQFIESFQVVAIDEAIAIRAGIIRRDFGKSHGTGLADAIIAATAEAQQADLVTLNNKHFQMLANVVIPYRKSQVL
ncbi:MAG TPA: VapC toxin family PIN domain ribonuclease [Blastocatellia bacterium]|nr:VapC toxin family PIN domain ribonuclease [Blastocatellia bacterium]